MPLRVITPFLLVTTNALGSLIRGSVVRAVIACETICSSLYLFLAPNKFSKKLMGILLGSLLSLDRLICNAGDVPCVGEYRQQGVNLKYVGAAGRGNSHKGSLAIRRYH